MFLYACDYKPPTMHGGCPDIPLLVDEKDIRGVFGIAAYIEPLTKSDEDLFGMRLVDGPNGRYRVSGVTRFGIRHPCLMYDGMGYNALKRADLESIARKKEYTGMILEWIGYS